MVASPPLRVDVIIARSVPGHASTHLQFAVKRNLGRCKSGSDTLQ